MLRHAVILSMGLAVLVAFAYNRRGVATATSARPVATPAASITVTAPVAEVTELPAPVRAEPAPADDRWVYPLPGVTEKWQTTTLGTFGARRAGRRPRECRGGHCGVDLHGPRGMPIVAVRAGIVERVHTSRRGKAGRYVALMHDDGSHTYYMHLDRTRRGLREGMEVAAGEPIGTLGRTGVGRSPPHLHFAWKLDNGKRSGYRNPARELARARIIPEPAQRGPEALARRQ